MTEDRKNKTQTVILHADSGKTGKHLYSKKTENQRGE